MCLIPLISLTRSVVNNPNKPRQNRLCWLIQKSLDKRSCLLHLKARETEYIPLVKLIPMVLGIDHRDLTNRVTTSMTPVGNPADSRGLATCCDSLYGHAR